MPHLAPRSLNGKFWLTFICTQLGQKVIEFAFEYSFEFNYFAVVQKYLVEFLTLYAISKEFWPHCIIFKLNWLITKKNWSLKKLSISNLKICPMSRSYYQSVTQNFCLVSCMRMMYVLLHCLSFALRLKQVEKIDMGGSFLSLFSPGIT